MKIRPLSILLLAVILLAIAACRPASLPPEDELPTPAPDVIAQAATATQPPAATLPAPTATQPAPTATQPAPTATQPAATATTPPPGTPAETPSLPPPPPLVVNATQPQGFGQVSGTLTYDADFLLRIDARRTNQPDEPGAGIERVEFYVSSATNPQIYTHTEYNHAYCIFSGGEPTCNPWPFADGAFRWGAGGPPIEPGVYFVEAVFFYTPESDDGSGITEDRWFFDFEIEAP
jgi:hypothetical protein